MPFASHDGVRIYWRLEGANDRPVLVLLNSIGTDQTLWDATLAGLLPAFRLLRIDTRGHGASDAPHGDYSLATLASDVATVMDAAAIGAAYVAGVSLGGMIAMQLALDHPLRVLALALVCTSATMDPTVWAARVDTVRTQGVGAIAEAAIGRFLSPGFAATHPDVVATLRYGLEQQSAAGYAGAGAAIRDMRMLDRLADISMPTLVITGTADISTPLAGHGEHLISAIPGAAHIELRSAHLPPIEAPGGLVTALRRFLLERDQVRAAEDKLFAAGLVNRRRILGDAWVDRSLANRTEFNTDFQALITRIAWHEIWSRPGLDDRTRRLLVIAITASLGHWEEFRLHIRSGLTAEGFRVDELKEVLLQAAIYAGVPAANTAFAEAGRIIAELDASGP